MFNIVLVEPEIPGNTGSIARTCAATGSKLHLVKPMGFSLEDKYLKRAGLDYWDDVNLEIYENIDELVNKYEDAKFYYGTTKATLTYADFKYNQDDNIFFVFGKETAGLPEELLVKNKSSCIRIPMRSNIRSLNLSNSACIVLYEALRQNDFLGLCGEGKLSRLEWED